jgi:hypothetical protein
VCFERGQIFLYQTIQSVIRAELAQASFFWNQDFLHSANLQAIIQAAGLLRALPKSSFNKLLLSTELWQHVKMSTTLKTSNGLKDAECKKKQLSNRLPIPYVPVVDIITPKEDPQVYKVKLPDNSHINMHIYSHRNNKEYLTHIVAVLRVIKQRGLDSRKLFLGSPRC